jgi:Superinfection immunity protein
MRNLADSYAFWIFALMALAVVYLLPTLIGMIRGVERLALVFLVNLIGAPTGIGWVAAMVLAFGPRRPSAGRPPAARPAGMPRQPGVRMFGPRGMPDRTRT